jgi:hypothetical protein
MNEENKHFEDLSIDGRIVCKIMISSEMEYCSPHTTAATALPFDERVREKIKGKANGLVHQFQGLSSVH